MGVHGLLTIWCAPCSAWPLLRIWYGNSREFCPKPHRRAAAAARSTPSRKPRPAWRAVLCAARSIDLVLAYNGGVGGESAEAPPVAEKARRFRGSGAIGAPEGVRESLCRNGGQAPTVLGGIRGAILPLRMVPLCSAARRAARGHRCRPARLSGALPFRASVRAPSSASGPSSCAPMGNSASC